MVRTISIRNSYRWWLFIKAVLKYGPLRCWWLLYHHNQCFQIYFERWVPLATPGSPPSSPSPSSRRSMEPLLTRIPTLKRSTWRYLHVCVCVKTKKTIQYNQAFRYFGWLAMTPMLVLNCLLCCTAFQMGEHNFMEDTYARILIKISLTQKGRVQLWPGWPPSLWLAWVSTLRCYCSQQYLPSKCKTHLF